MAQIIGMQNAGQTNGEEAQPSGQQPPMGSLQGAPEQPQDLGVTGTGGGNIGTGNVRLQGKVNFLVRLEQLDLQVKEALLRKEEDI